MSSTSTMGASPVSLEKVPAARASTARPLRILYVEQNLDGTVGGSYRSLFYLLKGLDHRLYEPVVAFYREHELLEDYKSLGFRTMMLSHPEALDFVSPVAKLGFAGRLLAPFARLAQKVTNLVWVSGFLLVRGVFLLLRERVDVLHLNNGVTVGNEMLIASKIVGIHCVIHQRGITPVPRWVAWLGRHADHFICVSEAARDNLVEQGLRADQCTAIHNGINPEELRSKIRRTPAQVRASLGIDDEKLIVGLAGMIRPWKGQMVLVRAMELLAQRHPHVHAIIMGGISDNYPTDRAYLNEIHACIAEHGLKDRITILDHQSNAAEFLQIFDIMVHTAIEPEPFSRVVIEGMSLALPIVASANGGTPEAIEDGVSGLLVTPNHPASLADGIDRLVRDPALRATLGQGALDKVERRFHIRSHVARTQAIYDTITSAVRAGA